MTSLQLPLVSILINNYNYGRFLRDAIESALNQTYPNVEVVVVDDGSSDDSREIIATYGNRIIPVLKGNGGQASAFNAGFAASKGDWIYLLDSDDIFYANKLGRISEVSAAYPSAGLIAHNLEYCTATDAPLDFLPAGFNVCRLVDDRRRVLWGKLTAYLPATSGLCIRRDVLSRALPMPEEIRMTADNYLKFVILSLAPVLLLPEALAKQRIHGANLFTLAIEDQATTSRLRCARINATVTFHLRKENPQLARLAWKQYGWILYQLRSCKSEETRAIKSEIQARYSVIEYDPLCIFYVFAVFTKTYARDLFRGIKSRARVFVRRKVGTSRVRTPVITTGDAAGPASKTYLPLKRRRLMVANAFEKMEAIYESLRGFALSEQWATGIVKAPISMFLNESFTPTVHWIQNSSRNNFLADCFGVIVGDRKFILAESFSYSGSSRFGPTDTRPLRMGRGYICSISVDENGDVISVNPAIDTGLHMSYPCTVYDRDSWYAVAEEQSSDRVNLYRREDNDCWSVVKELLPHAVIDPTVFTYNGRWWMFGTSTANPLDELLIWSADKLEGEWQPHPGNPIRLVRYNCRSAGTPFVVGDTLYRPTQNCTMSYGASVVINKVEELTRNSFKERPVRELKPICGSPFREGLHTLSAFGEWTLIDAKREVILPWIIARKVARHITKLSEDVLSAR